MERFISSMQPSVDHSVAQKWARELERCNKRDNEKQARKRRRWSWSMRSDRIGSGGSVTREAHDAIDLITKVRGSHKPRGECLVDQLQTPTYRGKRGILQTTFALGVVSQATERYLGYSNVLRLAYFDYQAVGPILDLAIKMLWCHDYELESV